jgi:hypothetical protein
VNPETQAQPDHILQEINASLAGENAQLSRENKLLQAALNKRTQELRELQSKRGSANTRKARRIAREMTSQKAGN